MIVYSAPGRINLIGEHTDYNQGFALPIALPQRTVVTYLPDDTDFLTVRSDREPGEVRIRLDTAPGDVTGWAAYVAGVCWAMREAGYPVVGGSMSITSTVEMGAGVSSSAALECAVLGALAAAAPLHIDKLEQARIAQRAENEYVGAPTGMLDQLASLFGAPRRALRIDFRESTVQPVRFDPDGLGVALLLIDSRTPHRHPGGEYASRRTSCELAAAELGVASLRDVGDITVVDQMIDPVGARRVRHVVTENQRVIDMVAALEVSDYAAAGRLLTASQASMRDDFEITTESIDLIADTAVQAGALGARMTGGGFGGCVIALVGDDKVDDVHRAVKRALRDAGHPEPAITRACAGDGAHSGQ
jgi:galactokinase